MDKKMEITVSIWTIVKILLCLILFWAVFYLRDIILIFLTAVVIASAVEGGAAVFVRRGWPRVLAVVLIYVSVIIFLSVFFYFILPPLLSDMADFVTSLPKSIDLQFFGGKSNLAGFQSVLRGLVNGDSFTEIATSVSMSTTAEMSSGFFQTATLIFGGIWNMLLIVVLSFYLSARKDGVENFLRLVSPERNEKYIIAIWKRSQHLIGRWFQGQVLLALMVGIFVYLGLSVIHVRHALFLGFISALFELIPVFGPIFAAIPGIAIGLLDGGLGKGLIVAALYTVIQQLESNVIYPIVVKKITGVPPLIVILALLVGFSLGGFLGVILAVPLVAVVLEIIYTSTQKPIREDKVELIS